MTAQATPFRTEAPIDGRRTTVSKPDDLLQLVGMELGSSEWMTVRQEDINLFAAATRDEQWIHVDVERARTGPYGGPVAHGYLTLSLLTHLWSEILVIEDMSAVVNYGLNKVRFPAPVPAGARVQLTLMLEGAERAKDGGIQATMDAVIRVDGCEKPVCIAQLVHRYYAHES